MTGWGMRFADTLIVASLCLFGAAVALVFVGVAVGSHSLTLLGAVGLSAVAVTYLAALGVALLSCVSGYLDYRDEWRL